MKIGKIQRQLKGPALRAFETMSRLYCRAMTSLTPNRALEDCGQFVKESWSIRTIDWKAPMAFRAVKQKNRRVIRTVRFLAQF